MFYINIGIESMCLMGLEALDERRRLGLLDYSALAFSDRDIRVEVDEGFARLYASCFQQKTHVYIKVPHSVILAGEIKETPGYNHTFHLSSLSSERAKLLFMKFKGENQ